ncbi:cupin domain-containing protein [Rhizobium rhizogenes]|uniref:cupin domain-containing protein n=1 Tax=Rhizobium rhizogenes TaxID=359 RepID=UPI0006471098|nr:cupin domain-containing protein [Rhizobium rhizogenes]
MSQRTARQSPAIHRAGASTQRSPDGIASAPFWVEILVESREDGGLTAMRCTLEPGTMTHWHTHPHGQILYVLSGVGLAERDGEAAGELRAGDCITFAPDERHRHGATPHSTFAYISIQAAQNGSAVTWLED